MRWMGYVGGGDEERSRFEQHEQIRLSTAYGLQVKGMERRSSNMPTVQSDPTVSGVFDIHSVRFQHANDVFVCRAIIYKQSNIEFVGGKFISRPKYYYTVTLFNEKELSPMHDLTLIRDWGSVHKHSADKSVFNKEVLMPQIRQAYVTPDTLGDLTYDAKQVTLLATSNMHIMAKIYRQGGMTEYEYV